MKKRILAIGMAALMTAVLAACGGAQEAASSAASTAESVASEAESVASQAESAVSEAASSVEEVASSVEEAASSVEEVVDVTSGFPDCRTITAGTPKDNYEITLLVKNLTNPYFVAVKDGAEQAGADYGVTVTVKSPSEESNDEQISIIQQEIARGVDALIIIPSDGDGIIPAVEDANNAGIPVFACDTRINGGDVISFIAAENYAAGYTIACALADAMGGKGTVIVLEGKAGASSAVDIAAATKDVFGGVDETGTGLYPDITLVASQTANWNRTDAYNVTLNLLEGNPDVTAILGSNDEMAMGALQAVDQAGKTGQILIAGINGTDEAKKAVDDGLLCVDIDKGQYDQGYYSVVAAIAYLNGEEVEPEYRSFGTVYSK